MPEPAKVRGQQVRQRLLAAAVELIAERGWGGVSTRVLAERAGVTPSVVHYHFPSMPNVLSEAVIGLMRAVVAETSAVLETASSPAEGVDRIIAELDRYSGTDPVSLVSIESYLAATRDDQLRGRIAEVLAELQGRFAAWLATHEVRSPEATARVLGAAIDGLLLHRGLEADADLASLREVLYRLVK
ncbi:MAG TPA: TetR/AcrR family transcriptional regulator [Stackebrandtia sp.]|nr:TetR/AcrR family transcriptional regulator [Stackebrandtia sp.]HZE39165.1 TetR/AcrR family transcriptional regulator [Stackebrandtia sp.]